MNKTKKPGSETNLDNDVVTQEVAIPFNRNSKSKIVTVPLRKKIELPGRLQSLLEDDIDHAEFQKKMELLRCRYKHAVKSELISFCYASSDPSIDTGLVPPSSTRNRDFVKTLMGIVEKDKEVADLAVGLVEDMDALERAKTGYVSKRSGPNTEESTFHQIWENHKKLRKQIAGILDEERKEIYGEKNVSGDVKIIRRNAGYDDDSGEEIDEAEMFDPGFKEAIKLEKATMASDIAPETDEEMREKEIRRGIQKIMRRLGCDDAYSAGSYQDNLKIIQKHFQSLKQDIQKLKE